jgi:hypothetical protein
MEPLITTTTEASELKKESAGVVSQNGDASTVPPPETTNNGGKAAGQEETNPKAENSSSWGLECHVLDEFVVAKVMPDTEGSRTKEEKEEGEKEGKGKDQWGGKNKKRGQNKNRPIFQQNPKVTTFSNKAYSVLVFQCRMPPLCFELL